MIAAARLAASERIPAGVLAAGAFFLPLLAMATPLAIAPLFALVVVAAALAWARRLVALRPPFAAAAIITLALAWCMASAAWALTPALVVRLWPQLALAAAGGLVLIAIVRELSGAAREQIMRAATLGLVIALALLTVEAIPRYLMLRPTPQQWLVLNFVERFNPSALNRAATVMAIAVWLSAGWIARRHGWRRGLVLPLWCAAVAPAFESLAAVVALGAGLGAAMLAACSAAIARTAIAIAVVGAMALMPIVPRLEPFQRVFADRTRDGSVWHRAEIWAFVSERIVERPIAGWGLNAARAVPGGKDEIAPRIERLPLHPHSAVLQLWLELGAIGAALGAALVIAVTRWTTRPSANAFMRFGTTGAAIAALTVSGTAYGLWQGWWMATLWLVVALAQASEIEPA